MDPIQLIQKDHRAVEALFRAFERAARDGQDGEEGRIVHELVRELSMHGAMEEELVYPALRAAGVEDDVLRALEEHHATKLTLFELDTLGPNAERFEAKVRVLAAEVRNHVEREERELLPRLRRALDPERYRNLGSALADAKRAAPTRPHPQAPDTPPGNVVANALAAFVDRARDLVRDAMGVMRMLVGRAGQQGAQVARFTMGRAEARSREVLGEAAQRGREAVRRGRARAIEEAGVRAGPALEQGGRRGEEAARRVRQAGRKVTRAAARAQPAAEHRETLH
ncbi:hemerythrin domain-containing protein [Anaeromyxobacter oryzisoli]|uniref:hemerythrin domain-containing protein n=1 Tax=Anaeromyxobacter oryzisoli TaxID=2925408 RepID=UPI001F58C7D8|nr:hemerythrin domain-containing protein [Anaeromyxobacter sp. SG63]